MKHRLSQITPPVTSFTHLSDNCQVLPSASKILLTQQKKQFMSALVVLIVVSMIVAGSFLGLFIFSVKKGQYDDDYTPSVRMLFDDGITTNDKQP